MRKHSDAQIQAAVEECGSQAAAAAFLGINKRTLERRLSRIAAGTSHDSRLGNADTQDGYYVQGRSTLYDATTGEPKLEWVKTRRDEERQKQILEAAYAAMSEDLPREPRQLQSHLPKDDNLLNCFVITDHHYGALAWGEETRGDDWDLSIAEDLMVGWFAAAINAAPRAKTAVFADLGDAQHYDALESVSPRGNNVLDTDTRLPKMVRAVIRATRRAIRMLLERHDHVHVIYAEGNHNMSSSVWMREWLAALYEDEPRVAVDTSPDPYYCYEHGKTSLFFHHGHLRKFENVQEALASKFREVYGRTQYSYAHTGHLHHKHVKETSMMVVEQHQCLAAADSYSSRLGFGADRSAQVITYHRDWGEVGRVRCTPGMVANNQTAA